MIGRGQMTAMSVPTLKELLVAKHLKNTFLISYQKSELSCYISITSCSSSMHRTHAPASIMHPASKIAPRSAAPDPSSPMAISAAAAATQNRGRKVRQCKGRNGRGSVDERRERERADTEEETAPTLPTSSSSGSTCLVGDIFWTLLL